MLQQPVYKLFLFVFNTYTSFNLNYLPNLLLVFKMNYFQAKNNPPLTDTKNLRVELFF